jgi:hypothetical protein
MKDITIKGDEVESLFRRIAEASRDMSHHAANCAPLHGITPETSIMSINIDSIIAPFLSEVRDDEDEETASA